jgi:2-C-methyl-D-erythritol 4-phosphate cytidylyltransferase
MDESHDVVIVAAGKGVRLGFTTPKAFVPLAGEPLLTYSLRAFAAHPRTGRLVVVVPEALRERTRELLDKIDIAVSIDVCCGGEQRWESVRNGVACCDALWVLVHDAARPFVSAPVIDALLAKRERYRCAITATAVVDTIRSFEGDRCVDTLDRSRLLRVGTPQLFHRETLLSAFGRVTAFDTPPTDEAMLMEALGIPVGFARGDPLNFKITTAEDLRIAEALCAREGRGER